VRCHYSTTTTLMSVVPSWAQARVRRNVNMMLTLRRTLDCVACVPVSRSCVFLPRWPKRRARVAPPPPAVSLPVPPPTTHHRSCPCPRHAPSAIVPETVLPRSARCPPEAGAVGASPAPGPPFVPTRRRFGASAWPPPSSPPTTALPAAAAMKTAAVAAAATSAAMQQPLPPPPWWACRRAPPRRRHGGPRRWRRRGLPPLRRRPVLSRPQPRVGGARPPRTRSKGSATCPASPRNAGGGARPRAGGRRRPWWGSPRRSFASAGAACRGGARGRVHATWDYTVAVRAAAVVAWWARGRATAASSCGGWRGDGSLARTGLLMQRRTKSFRAAAAEAHQVAAAACLLDGDGRRRCGSGRPHPALGNVGRPPGLVATHVPAAPHLAGGGAVQAWHRFSAALCRARAASLFAVGSSAAGTARRCQQ